MARFKKDPPPWSDHLLKCIRFGLQNHSCVRGPEKRLPPAEGRFRTARISADFAPFSTLHLSPFWPHGPRKATVFPVWVRRAAIRPVPPYARVPEQALERVEESLTVSDGGQDDTFSRTFALFEEAQPSLATRVATVLAKPMGETPLALGYFLSLAVWMSFDQCFGERVRVVSEEDIEAAMEALQLDEELRQEAPDEAIETDDVIAMEQPHLVDFVREHIDVALEADPIGVEVEEVDVIYRLVLLVIVSLSYSVESPFPSSPGGSSGNKDEWQA